MYGFRGEALAVYLAQPIGLGLDADDNNCQRPACLRSNRRAVGHNLLKLHAPAPQAGL